ncbi:MAG TPA: carbamoyltransferase [Candidatus Polarisedimenticolia bacterium]|nr:carbamoyltransferase [Candidatus Polarisedimenticolia bacterium]
MNILGISCFYHDAAACLIQDGRLVAAASEERFTRKKQDEDFPREAIAYCLKAGGISAKDLDYVGFYDKPFLKFERLLSTYLSTFPRGFLSFSKAMPVWLREKLWIPQLIRKELEYEGKILFTEHHLSHAASAFLVSPFQESAILTVDGVGEWATASYGTGRGSEIDLFKEIRFPHSLGLLYSAFTYYLGFKVNSAEYKVMGLAPYGEPRYVDQVRQLIDIKDDGSFEMDMRYFSYHHGLRMVNGRFSKLFGGPPREGESKLDQRHKDIAASVQKVTEEVMLKMAAYLHRETRMENLCLAGGVALNCVANGRILREGPFKDIFIQPAAGDAGGALGVAAYISHSLLGQPRGEPMHHAYLGPEYGEGEILETLQRFEAPARRLERDELVREVAALIEGQTVIGWFQGRMEFGPRALGSRSILADARNPENKDVVNLKIKFRESFRPFAPSVLEERIAEYFEIDRPSPYMLLVAPVREAKRVIPSVTHVDHSARIQSVNRDQNPLYYDLIREFDRRTGVPVIINTSFNVRGEPIVCSPEDAYRCFMRTHMDYLVLGPYLLDKKNQPPFREEKDWRDEFQLD